MRCVNLFRRDEHMIFFPHVLDAAEKILSLESKILSKRQEYFVTYILCVLLMCATKQRFKKKIIHLVL